MGFRLSRRKIVVITSTMCLIILSIGYQSVSMATMREKVSELEASVEDLNVRVGDIEKERQFDSLQTEFHNCSKYTGYNAWVHVAGESQTPTNSVNKGFNCEPLVCGHPKADESALQYMRSHKQEVVGAEVFIHATCEEIRRGVGVPYSYVLEKQTREFDDKYEQNFQIAYSIMMFKDFYQMERLLRVIYRPQHLFCIHVDAKSDDSLVRAVNKLATCFPNVYSASRRISVVWGKFSVLEADLTCMKDMYERSATWRYWINLTGQEFPLKTNAEIVKILAALNGANSMEATVKRIPTHVWQRPYMIELQSMGITPTKGAVHVIATRSFVEFLLTDATSHRILELIKSNLTYPSPAEMYFSTINFNPQLGAPGAYRGARETHPDTMPFINRLKNWNVWPFKYPCLSRKTSHGLCIWGVKDLPFVTNSTRRELFLNKLHLDFEYLALDCLENWLWTRSLSQISQGTDFDVSYYKALRIVSSHI